MAAWLLADEAAGTGVADSVVDFAEDQVNNITGATQADAATEAAQLQADAAQSAAQLQAQSATEQIAFQQQALDNQNALMSPYNQFGAGFMDEATQAAQSLGELYNDPSSIMSNPFFNAIMEQNNTSVMQNAAVTGRLDSGGTQVALQDSALRTGFDVLNQERAAQGNYLSMMQGMVSGGQNAAAGMGANQITTGANVASTMQNSVMNQNNLNTAAAAANAAGTVGAANASAAGTQNLIGLGTSLATGTPIGQTSGYTSAYGY